MNRVVFCAVLVWMLAIWAASSEAQPYEYCGDFSFDMIEVRKAVYDGTYSRPERPPIFTTTERLAAGIWGNIIFVELAFVWVEEGFRDRQYQDIANATYHVCLGTQMIQEDPNGAYQVYQPIPRSYYTREPE